MEAVEQSESRDGCTSGLPRRNSGSGDGTRNTRGHRETDGRESAVAILDAGIRSTREGRLELEDNAVWSAPREIETEP